MMQQNHETYRLRLETAYREMHELLDQLSTDHCNEPRFRFQVQRTQKRIAAALTRLQNGTFGRCQSCGACIAASRLTVLPYAENCLACQQQQEAAARSSRCRSR